MENHLGLSENAHNGKVDSTIEATVNRSSTVYTPVFIIHKHVHINGHQGSILSKISGNPDGLPR